MSLPLCLFRQIVTNNDSDSTHKLYGQVYRTIMGIACLQPNIFNK